MMVRSVAVEIVRLGPSAAKEADPWVTTGCPAISPARAAKDVKEAMNVKEAINAKNAKANGSGSGADARGGLYCFINIMTGYNWHEQPSHSGGQPCRKRWKYP